MRRPPPEAAEMRGFALVLGAFEGEKGQGGAPTRRFFLFFQPEEARLVLKLRAGGWELGAWRLATATEAKGEKQLAAGG